jgi:DNA-binding Xre family transcriptional regulator
MRFSQLPDPQSMALSSIHRCLAYPSCCSDKSPHCIDIPQQFLVCSLQCYVRRQRQVHVEVLVTIYCKLRLLLAKVNVERVKQGEPALSLRRLAEESGVSLSVLAALHTGKSQRIDYTTIDHLLTYFNHYLKVTTTDLLTWEQPQEIDIPVG